MAERQQRRLLVLPVVYARIMQQRVAAKSDKEVRFITLDSNREPDQNGFKTKTRFKKWISFYASLLFLHVFLTTELQANNLNANNWLAVNENRDPVVIVEDSYIEHTIEANGNLTVEGDYNLLLNTDLEHLDFVFEYERAVDFQISGVEISIDSGNGYSLPMEVARRSSQSTEAAPQTNGALPYYQLIRGSDRETMQLFYPFEDNSRVRFKISYDLTDGLERYTDLGMIGRFLIVDDLSYRIDHMEAVFYFPMPESEEPIDFLFYTFYRWQNPVAYDLYQGAQTVRVELHDVGQASSFEFVIAYPADSFPGVELTDERPIQGELDQRLANMRQREEAVSLINRLVSRSLIQIVIAMYSLAFIVIASIYVTNIRRGRRNRMLSHQTSPPFGISASGLSFLIRRKVTGQDLFAVMIELTGLGLLTFDKNIFTLAEPDNQYAVLKSDETSANDRSVAVGSADYENTVQDPARDQSAIPEYGAVYDERTGLWALKGRKGVVYLDQIRYVVWKALHDITIDLDGFSPSTLEKMSRKKEYSAIYYRVISDYAKAVKEELQRAELFDKHTSRNLLLIVLVSLYALLSIVLFALTLNWIAWLILVPALALAVLVLNIRSLSLKGHWALHHAYRFRNYLTRFSSLPKVKQPADEVCADCLQYAIAFGCEAPFLDELFQSKTQEELLSASFYRQTGSADLLRSSLATSEKGRQSTLINRMKQRYREGRVDMIGVVFNSKYFNKF